ncbi:MAG: pyridoxal-phosphate dependent enzyme [Bdellovibrionales bacterium]|nr:pyridoxal-phosphate dependent enzyme [Bdellovibrionales bacterium]
MLSELEKKFPQLQQRIERTPLVEGPTPLHPLSALGRRWAHPSLYVKREDQTHSVYGGNKVRNLEFVLGEAKAKGARRVLTLVPYGSNFTAALALHGKRLGLEVQLTQFIAQKNPQIEKHVAFCLEQQASIVSYAGAAGPIRAGLKAGSQLLTSRLGDSAYYWITPGASSLLGALGHTNAFLEFSSQRRAQGIPDPDFVIVGTGTCGTLAGLVAGAMLCGSKSQFIGVRCAEKIVCNPARVRRLATRVVRYLTGANPSSRLPFRIVDVPSSTGYAVPCPESFGVMQAFSELEGISLDTTYTAKVGLFLEQALGRQEFRGKDVLYWHTYCPNVQNWTTESIANVLKTLPEGVTHAVA